MPEKIGHRPFGSGHRVVRIDRRPDNPGYWLFVGRYLWQAIGQPERLRITHEEGGWVLAATDNEEGSYAVSNIDQDGIPRLTIGAPQYKALGLDAGTYAAVAYASQRIITIPT